MATTRRYSALALAAIAALALSACSSEAADDSQVSGGTDGGSEADLEVLESINWTDGDGDAPELEFDAPLNLSAPAVLKVSEGEGDVIEAGNNIAVDYTVTNGTDNSSLYSTYDVGQPETLSLAEGALDPMLLDAFVGSAVGSTYLYAAPDGQSATEGESPDTILMALTVKSRTEVLERAEGTIVEPAEDLPTVTLDDTGAPSIEMPAGDPPAELVAQPLIEGEGPEVAEGATITAHYTGWLWDGEQFDSSWEGGTPLTISLAPGGVIEGWTEGLVGQSVGSQVLLVIPPELGYGDTENGSIPANSTLVFVVDILDAQ